MKTLELRTTEGLTLRIELAGAGSRFAAGLIDLLLIGSGFLVVIALLAGFADVFDEGLFQFLTYFLVLGSLLVVALYQLVFHRAWRGQTPGKRVLGLRVLGLDGQPPSFAQDVMRALLLIPDAFVPLPLPLGIYVISLSSRRQRLGDLAADTVVVREERRSRGVEPWPRLTWSGLEERKLGLVPAHAGRFARDDLDLLREVVLRTGLEPTIRRKLLRRTARLMLERIELVPGRDPRPALKELYLFLREHIPAGR